MLNYEKNTSHTHIKVSITLQNKSILSDHTYTFNIQAIVTVSQSTISHLNLILLYPLEPELLLPDKRLNDLLTLLKFKPHYNASE